MPAGQLFVTVIEARKLRETEFFGTQDPYAVVSVNAREKRKTRVHVDGGAFANWGETFVFSVASESELFLEVWNKNTIGADDLIGKARHALSNAFGSREENCWITIKRGNNKDSGFVHLLLRFTPAEQGAVHHAPNSFSVSAPRPALSTQWSFSIPANAPAQSQHAGLNHSFSSAAAPANPYAPPPSAPHGAGNAYPTPSPVPAVSGYPPQTSKVQAPPP